MQRRTLAAHLPDTQQTAWEMAAIQLSGWTSLPILATSLFILETNSFLGSIFTIIVGNAVLWFIRLGIIAMSFRKRQSTLDLSKDYMGPAGHYFIALLLLIASLFWFIAQTTTGSHSITRLLPIQETPEIDQFTQISVLLGLISTLCCMGGIVLLKKLSMVAFPILIIAFSMILLTLPSYVPSENTNPLSFAGLSLVLSTNLGVTADLPTFFRHSRNWKTAVASLTLIQLVSLILGILSLYLGSIIIDGFELNAAIIQATHNGLLRYALIGFIFISLVCANVANVYSASVGWELIAPKALVGGKEYFILGLGITTIFILVSDLVSVELFLHITDNSLVKLCVVLILGYIISRQQKRAPDFYEQIVYFTAWLLSSAINALQELDLFLSTFSTLLIGTLISISVIFGGFFGRRIWDWGKRS